MKFLIIFVISVSVLVGCAADSDQLVNLSSSYEQLYVDRVVTAYHGGAYSPDFRDAFTTNYSSSADTFDYLGIRSTSDTDEQEELLLKLQNLDIGSDAYYSAHLLLENVIQRWVALANDVIWGSQINEKFIARDFPEYDDLVMGCSQADRLAIGVTYDLESEELWQKSYTQRLHSDCMALKREHELVVFAINNFFNVAAHEFIPEWVLKSGSNARTLPFPGVYYHAATREK